MRGAAASQLAPVTWLFAGLALAGLAHPADAPAQVSGGQGRALIGIVTDTLGRPIPLTSIADEHGRVRAVADDSGRFRIPGLTGRFRLTATRIGYRPVRLDTTASGDTLMFLALRLVPLPVTLPAEEIAGPTHPGNEALERLGFNRRMRDKWLGTVTGTFITPEELERRPAGLLSMALHGVSGIKLRPKGSDPTQWLVEGRGGCEMSVWIDGYMVQKGQAANLISTSGADLVRLQKGYARGKGRH